MRFDRAFRAAIAPGEPVAFELEPRNADGTAADPSGLALLWRVFDPSTGAVLAAATGAIEAGDSAIDGGPVTLAVFALDGAATAPLPAGRLLHELGALEPGGGFRRWRVETWDVEPAGDPLAPPTAQPGPDLVSDPLRLTFERPEPRTRFVIRNTGGLSPVALLRGGVSPARNTLAKLASAADAALGPRAGRTVALPLRVLVPDDHRRVLTTVSALATTILVPAALPDGFTCTVVQGGEGRFSVIRGDGARPQSGSGATWSAGGNSVVTITVIDGDLAAAPQSLSFSLDPGVTVSPTVAGQGLITKITTAAHAVVDPFRQAVLDALPGMLRWPLAGHNNLPEWHFDLPHTFPGTGSYGGEAIRDLWDPLYDLVVDPPAPASELVTLPAICALAQAADCPIMVPLDFRRAELSRELTPLTFTPFKPPAGYAFDAAGAPMDAPAIAATTSQEHLENELTRLLTAFQAQGVNYLFVCQGENNIGFETGSHGERPWLPPGAPPQGGGLEPPPGETDDGGGDDDEDDPARNQFIAATSVRYYQRLTDEAARLGMTLELGITVGIGKATKRELPMSPIHITNKRVALAYHIEAMGPLSRYLVLKADKYRRGWDGWLADGAEMLMQAPTDSGQGSFREIAAWFRGFCGSLGQGHLRIAVFEHMVFDTMEGVAVPTAEQGALMQAQAVLEAAAAGVAPFMIFPGFASDRAQPGFQVSRALTREVGGQLILTPLFHVQRMIAEAARHAPEMLRIETNGVDGLVPFALRWGSSRERVRAFLFNKTASTIAPTAGFGLRLREMTGVRRLSLIEPDAPAVTDAARLITWDQVSLRLPAHSLTALDLTVG